MPIYTEEEKRVKMPEIGEIKRGKELGYKARYSGNFIWCACQKCGKERWVAYVKGNPKNAICKSCASKPLYGKNNHGWKGGHHRITSGYIMIRVPKIDFFRPTANHAGYALEHRLIMAKHLGRNLLSWEVVHHLNGIKDDNRIENLQLLSSSKQHLPDMQLKRHIANMEKHITLLEAENALLKAGENVTNL